MNLENLMKKRVMLLQQHLHGISISNIPDMIDKNQKECDRRVLVIPSGIGSTNVNHFKEMCGITIAEGIDSDYVSNDTSFTKFVGTIETLRPTLIVAGSRGAELVARLLEEAADKYKGTILLLGPVYLSRVFDAKSKNRVVIVHGSKDKNENIESVRGLVASHHKKATLIEATNKGHDLSFEKKSVLANVMRYVTMI